MEIADICMQLDKLGQRSSTSAEEKAACDQAAMLLRKMREIILASWRNIPEPRRQAQAMEELRQIMAAQGEG